VIGWLDHTGQLHASDYWKWWPLILIGLGLAHMPQRQWVAAVAFVAIGAMFLPRMPFLPHVRLVWIIGVWPILISVGGGQSDPSGSLNGFEERSRGGVVPLGGGDGRCRSIGGFERFSRRRCRGGDGRV